MRREQFHPHFLCVLCEFQPPPFSAAGIAASPSGHFVAIAYTASRFAVDIKPCADLQPHVLLNLRNRPIGLRRNIVPFLTVSISFPMMLSATRQAQPVDVSPAIPDRIVHQDGPATPEFGRSAIRWMETVSRSPDRG